MKSRLKLINISIIILIFAMGCASDQDKKLKHFNKGTEYFNAEEYKKAEIEFKNAIQIDNRYAQAISKLGDTMMKLGQGKEAFRAFSQLEEIEPGNLHAMINLAKFYLLNKKPDEAIIRIEKILEKDNNNIEALYLQAQILAGKKDIQSASDTFEKILKINPDHIPSLQGLARIKYFQKDFTQAEALLLKAVKASPDTPQPKLALFSYYMSREDLSKAQAQVELIIKENPDNPEYYYILGNFHFKNNNRDKAEQAYKDAIAISPETAKPYLVLAGFYEAVNNGESSLELYKKAVSLDPENISAKLSLARFQFKQKNIDDAFTLASEVLDQRPGFTPAKMLKSEILIFKKDFNGAGPILNELENEEPNSPRVHYFKGLYLLGLGNTNQAVGSMLKAVELKPDYIKAQLVLADLYYRQRSFELAAQSASQVLALNESIYQARMILANSQVGIKKFKEAEENYKYLIQKNPDNPSAYYRLGVLYSFQKDYDKSEELLLNAYAINNQLMDIFSLRVRNHIAQGNYSQAHNLCSQQLKITKENNRLQALVHNIQASIYLAQKDSDKAAASYRKAIDNDPDYLRSYGGLAQILVKQKELKSAIEQYQKILEKNPNLAAPHMMMGTIYEMEQDFGKAEEHYRKALEIEPAFAPAANNLAYLLADRTDNYEDAFKFAKIAKEKLPNDPAVMDTMGLAYYKKGLYGNAVGEFTDSLKQIPENPVIHYHLGIAYHGKGDINLSIKALEKALKLSKDFPGAAEAKSLLVELKEG